MNAYNNWLHRHGVQTGLNSQYGAGFGSGLALQGMLGLALGGAGGARAATAPEDTNLAARAARAAAASCGASFTRGTKVLLASGAAVPIASLRRGDKVFATNTRGGRNRAQSVTAVLVHHDTNRYDLTVKDGNRTAVIHTTSTHLFWDPTTRRWIKAAALGSGRHLRTPDGANATVLGGYAPKEHAGWMWDLTVTADHDFYIQVVGTAVLVHNCDIPSDAAYQGALHVQEELASGNLSHNIPGVDMTDTDAVARYLDNIMNGPGYSVQGGKTAWYDPNAQMMVIQRTSYSSTTYQMSPTRWINWLQNNIDPQG